MRKYMPIGYEVVFFFVFDYKTSRLSNETMYLSSFDQETCQLRGLILVCSCSPVICHDEQFVDKFLWGKPSLATVRRAILSGRKGNIHLILYYNVDRSI